MSLCNRRCLECLICTFVRIDFNDHPAAASGTFDALSRAEVIDFYNAVTHDPENLTEDMAIILHVDGVDVAYICPKHNEDRNNADNECELF